MIKLTALRKPSHVFTSRILFVMSLLLISSCAQSTTPGARNVDIPSPTTADKREMAVNEKPDSVLYLPLGSDVLMPESPAGQPLPDVSVGPFELRSETLAGALQLILADYEIPIAFETEEGLTRTITVTNLRGPMGSVVDRVCGLADLYCSFEGGVLTVKESQFFTVSIPPIGTEEEDIMASLATGIEAITGSKPIIESGTRTLIYEATSRTSKLAARYLQRLRANTALVVFEVYIWEVSLNSGNATGVNWDGIKSFGKFGSALSLPGSFSGLSSSNAVSIGLPSTDVDLNASDVVQFLSEYGAVKTISQPQITMMSGGSATLRVADTEAYVSSLTRTVDDGDVSISTETDTVDTGFTMMIGSKWDKSTIYSNIDIQLQEVESIEKFTFEGGSQVGLPLTIERELQTQVRVRPGDSLLIAGLVRENDELNRSGPGFADVLVPTSRDAVVTNRELVFLLKPRVIAYTDDMELLRSYYGNDVDPAAIEIDLDKALLNPAAQISADGVTPVADFVPVEIEILPLDLLNPAL